MSESSNNNLCNCKKHIIPDYEFNIEILRTAYYLYKSGYSNDDLKNYYHALHLTCNNYSKKI